MILFILLNVEHKQGHMAMNDVSDKETNLHCHSNKTGTKAAKLLLIILLQNMQLTNYKPKTQRRVIYTCLNQCRTTNKLQTSYHKELYFSETF